MIEHLFIIPILLFSVIIHEIAHGWVALRLGDPTAKSMGRLTLNPIPHIDPIGSVIVPLLSLAAAGTVFIAWAKPVPIDPRNFQRPRRDDVLVSIAGPIANVILACFCTIAVIVLAQILKGMGSGNAGLGSEVTLFLLQMFYAGVTLNVVLAFFNLIPVPPLDGSHVLVSLLPAGAALHVRRIGFFGVFVLIALLRVPAVASAFHTAIVAIVSPFQSVIEATL
jgi:Zn-dependent protease